MKMRPLYLVLALLLGAIGCADIAEYMDEILEASDVNLFEEELRVSTDYQDLWLLSDSLRKKGIYNGKEIVIAKGAYALNAGESIRVRDHATITVRFSQSGGWDETNERGAFFFLGGVSPIEPTPHDPDIKWSSGYWDWVRKNVRGGREFELVLKNEVSLLEYIFDMAFVSPPEINEKPSQNYATIKSN